MSLSTRKMKTDEIAKRLLEGKGCKDCTYHINCNYLKKDPSLVTCDRWVEWQDGVFPMAPATDTIFYIKPIYRWEKDGKKQSRKKSKKSS